MGPDGILAEYGKGKGPREVKILGGEITTKRVPSRKVAFPSRGRNRLGKLNFSLVDKRGIGGTRKLLCQCQLNC